MFIFVEKTAKTPIYRQVYEGIRALISRGDLRPGDQIPSTRQLSSSLGISRRTVDQAFSILQGEGLIASHVGQGSFVAASGEPGTSSDGQLESGPVDTTSFWRSIETHASERSPMLQLVEEAHKAVPFSFVPAMPDPRLFPVQRFRRCVDTVLRTEGNKLSALCDTFGYYPLREHIAERLRRNSICVSPKEVLITSGCQQSLHLLSLLLVRCGDTVLVENPTFPGALRALSQGGPRLLGFPCRVENGGLAVLERLVERETPKFIYMVPNFQNPTGGVIDRPTRERIIEIALTNHVPVVEDDVFGELHYSGPRMPTLKALDQGGSVVLVNSFSKVLNTSLRVGWAVAPSNLIEQLADLKEAIDLQGNAILQAALNLFCRRGILDRHIAHMTKIFKGRREAILTSLAKHFPRDCSWSEPQGGLCIWVTLPPEIDSRSLLLEARAKGVAFFPGGVFFTNSPSRNQLRLGFGTLDPSEIREGIKLLGDLLTKSHRMWPQNVYVNRARVPVI